MDREIEASVIIPVYNARAFLKNCLTSIFDTAFNKFEVIVVNDGSNDHPEEITKQFNCRLVSLEKNSGPARARNQGIRLAQGKLFLFTDADCLVQKDWVRLMCEEYYHLENELGHVGAMGARIIPNQNFVSKCLGYSGYYAFQHGDVPVERPDLCAGSLLVVRRVFEEVGGFNEKLISGEDTELSFKIYEQGYRVFYNPGVYVRHDQRKTLFEFFRHQEKWGEEHGLQLEIRYQRIRRLPKLLLNRNPYIYLFFLSVPVALGITFKSISANFKYDKKILIYAPFIFISKLFYRWGVVKWLFKNRKVGL